MTEGLPIRVLLVDDHPVVRDGLAAILSIQPDIEVVGEAANGAKGVEEFRRLKPDVTLMDMQMPVLDGIAATVNLRREFPGARIIVLTTYAGDAQAARAIKAGAAGYLLKSALRKDLVETIRSVHSGRRHVDPEIACKIAIHSGEEQLTERELEILRHVAAGSANKQIARALSVSEDTVKGHLKSIFGKLKVQDRTQAAVTAMSRGIISL